MPDSPAYFITGQRIALRGVTLDDANETYLGWLSDPLVTRYLESRYRPPSLAALRDYVARTSADPESVFLAIVLRESGRHIGNIKLGPINWIHRFADVGIMIGERDCWGQGYATEAIGLLTEFAFTQLNLHRLTAGCYATNVGSARAFVKSGWSTEGRRPRHYYSDGGFVDGLLLGITRAEDGSAQGGEAC